MQPDGPDHMRAGVANPDTNSVTAAGMPMPQANAVVTGLALVAALYFGRAIFVPLALAILLTFLLAPPVRLLRSWHVGRVLSVVLVVCLAFVVIFGLGAVLGQQVAQLAEKLPEYQVTIAEKIRSFQGASNGTLQQASTILNDLRQQIAKPLDHSDAGPPSPTTGLPSAHTPIPVEIRQPEPGSLELLQRVLDPLLGPLATTGIIIVFVIFILLQREDLRDRVIKLFGSHDLKRTTAAIDDAARRLSRYFLAQTALNAVFGLLVGIGLAVIGVPSPVLWGILAMVLRFVPYIGAVIAAGFPLVLAAAVDPGWSMVLWTLALFLVLEPIVGQVVEPMLYGQSTGISPVAVVIAATFWTWLWGPIGLLLSTPLTVCLGVIGRHVDRLQFLDVLFGDRPPLSPAQSFYQRTLAGDADEAVAQAEIILEERSLSRYYDEVALRGLMLAQTDVRRGYLEDKWLAQIRTAVQEIVDDLEDYEDAEPDTGIVSPVFEDGTEGRPDLPVLSKETLRPEWRGQKPVLCIPGRSPLDVATGLMFVQLLEKHGIGARLEPQETLFSAQWFALDGGEVRFVCLAHLDMASGARIRHAIRRLRRRLPKATILAGIWGNDEMITGRDLHLELGADLFASSLRQAVSLCIAAAEAPAQDLSLAQREPGAAA
jgi:predicted PurR-regulated permease PerM